MDTLEILVFSLQCSQCPWDRLNAHQLPNEKVIQPERKVAEDAEEHVSPSARGIQAMRPPGQQGVQDGAQHRGEVGVAVRRYLWEVALQPQQVVLTVVLPHVCWKVLHQLLF